MRVEMGGVVRRDGLLGAAVGLVAATVLAAFLGAGLLSFAGERLMGTEKNTWNQDGYTPVFTGSLKQ